jgi:hypothetical protein
MLPDISSLSSEDAWDLRQRTDALLGSMQPRDEVERRLIEQISQASWLMDRAILAQTSRITAMIKDAPRRELEEVDGLAERLFCHHPGPPEQKRFGRINDQRPGTSRRRMAGAADDPAKLIRQLENSVAGCERILEEWRELLALLVIGKVWQSDHKFRAIRLLGKNPHAVAHDEEIAGLLFASWLMNPKWATPYCDLLSELDPGAYRPSVQQMRKTHRRLVGITDHEHARQVLVSIVERSIERVTAKLAVAQEHAERYAAQRADRLSFDDSAEGARLRRVEASYQRTFFRSINEYYKVRRAARANSGLPPMATASPGVEQECDEAPKQTCLGNDDPQCHTSSSAVAPPTTDGTRQGDNLRLAG